MNNQIKLVLLLISFFANFSIGQIKPIENKSLNDKNKQEIYNFIQLVIDQTELKKDYKLSLTSYEDSDITNSFLKKFLIDTVSKVSEKKSSQLIKDSITGKYIVPITSIWPSQPKVLTANDINYMLEQKKYSENFKWDNSIFNFNQTNNDNWYSISLPLFSTDKSKVIVTIVDRCKGLCGTGYTYLFIKVDDKWKKETISFWVH